MTAALLHSSATTAQLVRFAAAGGAANLVHAAAFLLVAGQGVLLANVAASLVSSAVANELHRRLTFRAGSGVGWWTAQLQGGATAAAGLGASTGALVLLEVVADPQGLAALLVVAVVGGAVGLARFLLLRRLFTPGAASPGTVVPLRHQGAPGAAPRPAALVAAA